MTRRTIMSALALAALALTGCGGPVPIQGKIVWDDGSPAAELQGGQVMFSLPGAKSSVSSRGMIGPGGTFTMSTGRPGDGVYPGTHRAAVIENRAGGGEGGAALAPARLDPKFSDPDTSGLTPQVDRAGQVVTLTVGRAGGKKAP